jgi:hypothetical protein
MRTDASISPLDENQPWPGSRSFTEKDHAFFFGRHRQVEELQRLLKRDTCTLLFGPAASGKTSLIRAGLAPALAGSEYLPVVVRIDWKNAQESPRPAQKILEAIAVAAQAAGLSSAPPTGGDSLWEAFHRTDARFWSSRQHPVAPVIVLDQFEEIFTEALATAKRQRLRDHFLEELSELITNRPPLRVATRLEDGDEKPSAFDFEPVPVRVLLVVREEFLGCLAELRRLFPTIHRGQLRLGLLSRDRARRVLREAAAKNLLFEDGVVDAVVERLAQNPVGHDPGHPISPKELSVFAHRLATERLTRRAEKITADFFVAPKTPDKPESTVEFDSSLARHEVEMTESQARKSPVALLLCALLAVIGGALLFRPDRPDPSPAPSAIVSRKPPSPPLSVPPTEALPAESTPAVATPLPPATPSPPDLERRLEQLRRFEQERLRKQRESGLAPAESALPPPR